MMSNDAQPSPMVWRRFPVERRRRLAVLIGRLAYQHLEANTPVEDSYERHAPDPDRQDPQLSP